jgi:hypothetical protein
VHVNSAAFTTEQNAPELASGKGFCLSTDVVRKAIGLSLWREGHAGHSPSQNCWACRGRAHFLASYRVHFSFIQSAHCCSRATVFNDTSCQSCLAAWCNRCAELNPTTIETRIHLSQGACTNIAYAVPHVNCAPWPPRKLSQQIPSTVRVNSRSGWHTSPKR